MRIDLLFTDVTAPGMAGWKRWHDVPVIHATGDTNNAVVRHGHPDSGTIFLQRPRMLTQLNRKSQERANARMMKPAPDSVGMSVDERGNPEGGPLPLPPACAIISGQGLKAGNHPARHPFLPTIQPKERIMADKREMGPKRPAKVVYIIMAAIVLVVVTTFVGMNISHKNQMENSQADGTSTQTQGGGEDHAPTGSDQPPR